MKDNFLKNIFNDLNDISGGTDDEVTAELEAMGVDVEGAKKRFEETIKKCRAKATFNIRLDDEQLKSIAEKIARLEASENSARVRLSYVESELEALKKDARFIALNHRMWLRCPEVTEVAGRILEATREKTE